MRGLTISEKVTKIRREFGNIAQEAILYVPIGCKSAYEASDWTNYFETIVEMN